MKRSFAFRKVAVAAIALTLGSLSQPQESMAQTINIGPNQYAFRYTLDNDYGLFFNSASQRYEFRNGSANSIFGFDANTGAMTTNLEFASGSDLRVGLNRYAFRSSVAPNEGLYVTSAQLQFRNAAATPIFAINTADGKFDSDIEFLVGKNLRVAAGNYAIRSATSPNAGLYFGAIDYELRNAAGNPVFRVSSVNGNTVANGSISASGGNSGQWNSAFGWGNHATMGYISSESDPKISGALATSAVPRWNGTQLAASAVTSSLNNATITGLPSSLMFAGTPSLFLLNLENPGGATSLQTNESRISFSKANVQVAQLGTAVNDFVIRMGTSEQFRMNPDGRTGFGTAPQASSTITANKSSNSFSGGAVHGTVSFSGSTDVVGVRGTSVGSPGYGYGAYGTGGYMGVRGEAEATTYTGSAYGVYGRATGTAGIRIGVYGNATGGTTNWASYFVGNSYVSGDMRIGSLSGATGYKLSVNGKIICTEARVQAVANWPDYVFADDYALMSLEELEKFLATEKHLPGIPSADELIEAEGFDLGDMHKMTIEKVEELTLYIIAQNKRLLVQDELREKQDATLAKQQEEIEALKVMILNLVKN